MILSQFKSVEQAYVDKVVDADWNTIAKQLTKHIDSPTKAETPLFNLFEFKKVDDPTTSRRRSFDGFNPVDGDGNYLVDDKGKRLWVRSPEGTYKEYPNTVRRCTENVVALHGIILDIDATKSIEEAIVQLDGYEYVLYTTFRHTPEKNKFRVILPFSRALLAKDIVNYKKSIMQTFPDVDNCSFTLSQCFYFHSGKVDSISFRVEGKMIDPYEFEYEEIIPYVAPLVTTERTPPPTNYKQAVIDSLNTCSGLHYDGTHGTKYGVLMLAQICRSIDLTYAEFDNICARIADPASALVDPNVRRMAWTGQADRNTVRKETRDSFIAAYGGKPVKTTYVAVDDMYVILEEQMKKMKERITKWQN